MSTSIMQGICIGLYQQGLNDATVVIYTRYNIVTLYALGIFKSTSKNRANLNLLSYGEYEYFQARLENKVSKLKTANQLKAFDITNLGNQHYLNRLSQLFLSFEKTDKQLFDFFSQNYHLWGHGQNTFLFTYLLFLSLKPLGIAQNFKSCIVCNRHVQIIKVDLQRGGFLCTEHSMQKTPLRELKGYYYMTFDFASYVHNITLEENEKIKNSLLAILNENGISL